MGADRGDGGGGREYIKEFFDKFADGGMKAGGVGGDRMAAEIFVNGDRGGIIGVEIEVRFAHKDMRYIIDRMGDNNTTTKVFF